MAAAFISYRREDSAGYAGRLHEELEQRLGRDQVFRDVDSLHGGQDFVDTINARLARCDALVAMIGPQWLGARTASGALRLEQPDDYVALEIGAALARPDVVVIPVLVGGATMPDAGRLPLNIRALARRHALTLRDESWEADVDRLAEVVAGSRGKLRPSRRRGTAAIAVGLLALLAAFLLRNAGQTGVRRTEPDGPPPPPAASSPKASTPPASSAYAIDIPQMAEVAHGSVIYTLISGSVSPRGNANGVRLRFRASNEGRYDANLWDASFRLAIGDDVVTPTGGLNEILAGNSIRHAIVSFTVPPNTSRAVLRVLGGSDVAELPLDLSPTGRPPEDEKADAGDALSKARLAAALREPVPLIQANDFSATLLRVTTRLFVNKRRVVAVVRMTNAGRYPAGTGHLTLRLAHGDELAAPVSTPNAVIDPGATFHGDVVFEIPPSATNVELRATAGSASAKVPLDVR